MNESAAPILSGWAPFFATMCTSDAALIGLMFVVVTLVAGIERAQPPSPDGISTYSTPNVMHFCIGLFVSAVCIAPWRSMLGPDVAIGLAGLFGLAYALRVIVKARNTGEYVPDAEDWTWYTILPVVAYCAILGGAIALSRDLETAIYVIGGSVLLLTFIGIRNSWDVVTYLAMRK